MKRRLAVYAPVLLAVASLVPRILHAHFGLLDDAVTLGNAQAVLAHPAASLHAYQSAGRFLPVYWLYWAACYALGRYHAAVFYLGNAALLALSVATLIALMRRFQATLFMTWAASLCFIFSAPAADAYGTLSKGEPLALAAMLGSLWMAQSARWLPAAALALVAAGAKETALVLAPIVAAWYLLAFWRKPIPMPRRSLVRYLAVLLAAMAPILLGRLLLRQSLAAGAYAARYQLTAARLSESGFFWGYNLARNFPQLPLLLLAAAVLAACRRLRQPQLLLASLVWMLFAAAILLPWPHADPYYDLIFTAGSSVFCGVLAGELLRAWWTRPLLLAAAALWLVAAIDSLGLAQSQIHVDEVNAGLLAALRQLPPRSVVLVNIPANHEYLYELRLHAANLLARPDLRIEPLQFQPLDDRPRFVAALELARQPWPLVRGPMTENVVADWKTYADSALGASARPTQIAAAWPIADLDLGAFWCGLGHGPPLVCPSPPLRPTFDRRQTFYAWNLYPYPRRAPVEAASFDRGVWTIEQPTGAPLRLALGVPGDLPIAADWEGDGLLAPGVYRPSLNRWFIDRHLTGRPDLVFSLPGMRPGDLPVAGAWEGRAAGPGFYRPADLSWHLFRSPASPAEDFPVVHLGSPDAIPLAGDWDGDGRATPGFYRPGGSVTLVNALADQVPLWSYTLAPGAPVVANWTGAGVDTVNTTRDGHWDRRLANCFCPPANPPAEFSTAPAPGQPFAGRWKSPHASPQTAPPAIR